MQYLYLVITIPEIIDIDGTPVRVYPTTIKLPLWTKPLLPFRRALTTLKLDIHEIKLLDQEISNITEGLVSIRSGVFNKNVVYLNAAKLYSQLKQQVNEDGVEIVDWMFRSHAENLVMRARIYEYNRLGSRIEGESGEAYIPGVYVVDMGFRSELGSTVRRRGYAILQTPRGNVNISVSGGRPFVARDYLAWGSVTYVGFSQYTGNALRWLSLAETPVTQSVGFYRDTLGNVAPNFFVQTPPRPALRATVNIVIQSDRDQTIRFVFRDPADYSRELKKTDVRVQQGTTNIQLSLSAIPFVPPVISQIQPQNETNTVLRQYIVVA